MTLLQRFLVKKDSARPIGWAVFAAGMLMTLGFAPFFIWPLSLASLAFLFWLIKHARNHKQAAGAALVWGMGHQITAIYWLPRAFYLDADNSWLAGILGGVPAMLGIALYGALGTVLVALATRRAPLRARALVFVLAWLLLDMLKAATPYGFPWLPTGAVWAGDLFGAPYMAQLASVGGVFLLSATILTSAVLCASLERKRLAIAASLIIAVAGFGAVRLHSAPSENIASNGPIIRMVQPNIQSALRWDERVRLGYLRQTLELAFAPSTTADGRAPDAIVLPETAVAFYLDQEPELRQEIAMLMQPHQTLLTGTIRRETDPKTGDPTFANSFAALNQEGRIIGYYNKHLLVPFGEFIPLRSLIDRLPLPERIESFNQSRLDYAFGTLDPRIVTPAGVVEGLICYEGIFPWFVARHSEGVDWLVNITNDNWFTGTTALFQHASLARLRAIETGKPLIRVANTGWTVAFDGWGRRVANLPINTPVFVDLPLPLSVPKETIFSRILQ